MRAKILSDQNDQREGFVRHAFLNKFLKAGSNPMMRNFRILRDGFAYLKIGNILLLA